MDILLVCEKFYLDLLRIDINIKNSKKSGIDFFTIKNYCLSLNIKYLMVLVDWYINYRFSRLFNFYKGLPFTGVNISR